MSMFIAAVVGIMIGIWAIAGIVYMIVTVDDWTPIPKNVGDLVIGIFFLPHSILMYFITLLMCILEKIIIPMVNSDWWNKPLRKPTQKPRKGKTIKTDPYLPTNKVITSVNGTFIIKEEDEWYELWEVNPSNWLVNVTNINDLREDIGEILGIK